VKLALDHHYSKRIAEGLRRRGFDVVAAVERGWSDLDDESLLEACPAEERALLTNNVADFAVIARRWASEQRSHHGLIYTSDAARPRTLAATGRFVDDLATLMSAHGSFTARTHWL